MERLQVLEFFLSKSAIALWVTDVTLQNTFQGTWCPHGNGIFDRHVYQIWILFSGFNPIQTGGEREVLAPTLTVCNFFSISVKTANANIANLPIIYRGTFWYDISFILELDVLMKNPFW